MTVANSQAGAREFLKADAGYNQLRRTKFFDHKTGALIPHKAADCSISSGYFAYRGGYITLKTLLGVFYTGNFVQKMRDEGGCDIITFKSLSQVRAGDWLITPGHHVVYALTEKVFVSWEYDERGKASGGRDGIQHGERVGTRGAYVRPGGWRYIVRPRSTATWKGRALAAFAAGDTKSLKKALQIVNNRASHDGPLWTAFVNRLAALNKGVKFSYVPTAMTDVPGVNHAFVVLGSGLSADGKITGKFSRRLKLALAALKAYPNSKVLVTGGKPEAGVTEGEVGKAWLVGQGIDASRILTEEKSESTIGNADYSVPILRTAGIKYVTLVSDASHLRRALELFYAAVLKIETAENVSLGISFTKPLAYNDYAPKAVTTEGAVSVEDRDTITSEVASLLGLIAHFNAAK